MKPIKIAIISCSHGHASGYYRIRNEKYFDLVAVSIAPGFENSQRMEMLDGIPKYKSDVELYENHPDLEAVILASENANHMQQVREAASRGLHILSMKIPTFNLDEYAEMIRISEEAGIVFQVELEMRNHASVERVKRLIDEGAIGDLLSVNVVNYSSNPVDGYAWMCDPYLSFGEVVPLRPNDNRFRGGALSDHPHAFDVVRYLTDSEFDTIYADVSPNIRDHVVTEDMIRLIGRMKNGVTYSVDPSYACDEERGWGGDITRYPRGVEVFMTAVGTKGTIIADLYGKTYCCQSELTGAYFVSPYVGSSGLWNRVTNEFYHCIREGEEPTITLRIHHNTIRTMVAGYESVRTGEVIKIKYE